MLELTSAEIHPEFNPVLKSNSDDRTLGRLTAGPLKIGIARDRAFGFYYPDDIAAFESAGVELVPFDTLSDQYLPDVDGIFIGGGFPECFIEDLATNKTMRSEIKMFIESGGPAYAEYIRPVDMLIPTTLNVSDAIFVPTFARPVILTWVWVNRSRAIDARESD